MIGATRAGPVVCVAVIAFNRPLEHPSRRTWRTKCKLKLIQTTLLSTLKNKKLKNEFHIPIHIDTGQGVRMAILIRVNVVQQFRNEREQDDKRSTARAG